MKKPALLLSLLFLFAGIASAQFKKNKTYDAEGMDGEYRDVPDFKAVKVCCGIDLVIHQSDERQVRVHSEDIPLPRVKTEVKNGMLHIGFKKTGLFNFTRGKAPKVEIWIDDLNYISAWGGADVNTPKAFQTQQLEVKSKGGSDMNLKLAVEELTGSSSGGSDLTLSGEVRTLKLHASGGSDIRAKAMEAESCEIRSTGGSDAFVMVREEVAATAGGGSDIYIEGSARMVHQKTSGGSDIHFKSTRRNAL